jgi:hypothetical protein
MENSLYISSSHFIVLSGDYSAGKVKVRGRRLIPLPIGATINGIVTDANAMTDFLASVISEYGVTGGQIMDNALTKGPSNLCIHTNSIQTKILEMPPVQDSQIREFIKAETEQMNVENADNVIDYTVITPQLPSGGIEVLAVVVARDQIETYRDVFIHAGFNLRGINVGANCLIKLVRKLPQLQGQSFMLSNVEAESQTISLFVDGAFKFSNRYRLVNAEGTPEWIAETAKNLSTVIQFSKAQRSHGEITKAYFAGLSDTQTASLAAEFESVGVQIEELDLSPIVEVSGDLLGAEDFSLGRVLFNIGNFIKV